MSAATVRASGLSAIPATSNAPRPVSLSGNVATVRQSQAVATVRATIAGNAPQPPALAFLRAGRVRARPAVPRPCKAVLRALQVSVNPARIPANIAATYSATSNAANVPRPATVPACQHFDRAPPMSHFATIERRAGFRRDRAPVIPANICNRSTVANMERGERAQPFRPVSLSGKPWRFDVRRLSAVRPSAPDSSATYPASRPRRRFSAPVFYEKTRNPQNIRAKRARRGG